MSLLNSRLGVFSCGPDHCSAVEAPNYKIQILNFSYCFLIIEFSNAKHWLGRPYCELTAAFLPSSLRKNHLFALVYSTNPPVSVYGTDLDKLSLEAFLGRLFSHVARRSGLQFNQKLAIKSS